MDCLTFLNDKKIYGELYAYLQELSIAVGRECYRMTIVKKDSLPTQSIMCEKLGIKSPKTLRAHIDYLKQMGYIIEDDEGNYILPEKEDIFLMLPLDTLKYLNNNCRDHVIKIYVYLGQRFKMASSEFRQYEFTLQEIGEHIGIKVKNNSNLSDTILCGLAGNAIVVPVLMSIFNQIWRIEKGKEPFENSYVPFLTSNSKARV